MLSNYSTFLQKSTYLMKTNKLTDILKEIGLSENEANVYSSLLSLGPATVLNISKTSEIKRTTVYSVLESLKQKGLVNLELQGFKQLYAAENPSKLEHVLESRKEKFKDSLPEFMALYSLKGGESFIKYYEGLEGVKSVYESLIRDIKPHENYSVIGSQKDWHDLDEDYFQDFIERRAKLNINIRLLLTESEIAKEHKKFERNYNEHIKFLPENTSLTTNMVVTPQKIVIQQLTQPIMAIVIENKSIVKMHQELFEVMWNSIPEDVQQK